LCLSSGLQKDAEVVPLREEDAFPAEPAEGHGPEKLYMEKLCQYFTEDWGFATCVVRFHNVYGPLGIYDGGREKAPAAICRKIAALSSGEGLEIWGDGKQTRSFMYIDDCVEGIYRIMRSDYSGPLNLGTDELVNIDERFARSRRHHATPIFRGRALGAEWVAPRRPDENSECRFPHRRFGTMH
jgi:nucleoside-diphosphate-sugar epimerase